MNVSQDVIQDIRIQNDIVEVIGEYLPLVKKGKNYFGVCPFHDDTNPSMSVSKEKQIYTCFSCGATGNVISFVMNYEHLSFMESLKKLADRQGMAFQYQSQSKVENLNPDYEIYQLLNKFYRNNISTSYGQTARMYLKNRQITDELIKEFEIGLSPKKADDATKLLLDKGYTIHQLENLGISNQNDHRANDVFYHRIMFPIWDASGHVVAYSGRIYEQEDTAKYVNTKETSIFKKGNILYNYHRAKEEVRKNKYVILMEGQLDVIRAHSVGIKNVIATMGTALTKEHIALMKRLSYHVTLCFDGDQAGEKATLSAGNALFQNGFEVKVIRLSDEMDPDEFILKYGSERFQMILNEAKSFIDYKIDYCRSIYHFDDSVDVSKFLELIAKDLSMITDPILQETVLNRIAREVDIGVETLKNIIKKETTEVHKKELENLPMNQKQNRYDRAEQGLLYYMLQDDKVIQIVNQRGVFFKKKEYRYLANEIIYFYKQNGSFELADFLSSLADKKELETALAEVMHLSLPQTYVEEMIYDDIEVLKEYHVSLEVKRLKEMQRKEMDPIKKAEIGMKIVELERGSFND